MSAQFQDPLNRNRIRLLEDAGIDLRSGVLKNLIRMFLDNTGTRLQDMEKNLATLKLMDVARTAHTLKASCGTLGAENMARLADSIETHAREGQADGISDTIDQLKSIFPHVRNQLEEYLRTENSDAHS